MKKPKSIETVVTIAVDSYEQGTCVMSRLGAYASLDPHLHADTAQVLEAITEHLRTLWRPVTYEEALRMFSERASHSWEQLELF